MGSGVDKTQKEISQEGILEAKGERRGHVLIPLNF